MKSTAKILRPIDVLARHANRIIAARSKLGPWPDCQKTLDAMCHHFAEESRLMAVGFYARNLQHKFDMRLQELSR